MNHTNITQIYDACATADGRPLFVMEYVRGVPITENCDVHRLSTRKRLELFVQVCNGVQHTHQKGVIHRDLNELDIDTRTDIYALGVVLDEMLVGELPLGPRKLRHAGFDEMRRRIREEEPPRPSSRISHRTAVSTAEATTRGLEPATLFRQLSGDLD